MHPLSSTTPAGVWRDGTHVVMERNARLPWRCVKCNAPAITSIHRRLRWSPVSPFLRVLQSPFMHSVLRASFDKTASVEVGLCARHHGRHRALIAGGAAGFALGLLLLVLTAKAALPEVALVSLGLFVCAAACAVAVRRLVVPVRIDDRFVRFGRASRPYLDSLPPLPPNLLF